MKWVSIIRQQATQNRDDKRRAQTGQELQLVLREY